MSENNDVLYIPGLGGRRSLMVQRPFVRLLDSVEHRHFYFFDAEWEMFENDPEQHGDKLKRLNSFYEESGKPSIVYANSAGASLATLLTIEQPAVEQCHLVCGKILGALKIGPEYSERAPAFVETVAMSEKAVNELDAETAKKFTCYVPGGRADDGVLEVVDMIIPGARIVELPPLSHAKAIIYAARKYLPHL